MQFNFIYGMEGQHIHSSVDLWDPNINSKDICWKHWAAKKKKTKNLLYSEYTE